MLPVILSFILSLIVLLSCSEHFLSALPDENKCKWTTRAVSPEVFWINLDHSVGRRKGIEHHLDEVGLRHFRVRGLTPNEIYIPEDLAHSWKTNNCKLHTSWTPPDKLNEQFINRTDKVQWNQYAAYMGGLCGRYGEHTPKNTMPELAVTVAHLHAIRQAVYSTTAKSRYALIIEDDIFFPFDIDFELLAQSAPAGFGILQLFNSHPHFLEHSWKKFQVEPSYLWTERHPVKMSDLWGACAYLIDRYVLKPVIDALIKPEMNGWTRLEVIAGIVTPHCNPRECCDHSNHFIQTPPCVLSHKGFQSDAFLYSTVPTYFLSIPILFDGAGSNHSTIHQSHVESLHRKIFEDIREIVSQLYIRPDLPSFLHPACSNVTLEAMESRFRYLTPM